MIELKGTWTKEDMGIYLKNNPNKIIIEEKKVFVSDINE